MHDYFNEHGAQADVGGRRIELVGDGDLLTSAHPDGRAKPGAAPTADNKVRHVTDRSKDTFDAAAAAARAGIAEVHQAHALGAKGEDPERVPDLILRAAGGEFAAEQLMPHLAPDSTVSDPAQRSIEWQVPQYQDLFKVPRMAEALRISLRKYAGLIDDALPLKGVQKDALDLVLKKRMLGSADDVVALIEEVLRFVPPAPSPLYRDIQDLKTGMH
jgi:hypothetical protein